MFLQYFWKNKEIPYQDGKMTMHYGQTTDESVCCQIFPGMLPDENNANFDVTNISFWVSKNPWQIIFDGYKKGITPGKQVNYIIVVVYRTLNWNYDFFLLLYYILKIIWLTMQQVQPIYQRMSKMVDTACTAD